MPGRTLPVGLMVGDAWMIQIRKQYCFKPQQLSTVSLVTGREANSRAAPWELMNG